VGSSRGDNLIYKTCGEEQGRQFDLGNMWGRAGETI